MHHALSSLHFDTLEMAVVCISHGCSRRNVRPCPIGHPINSIPFIISWHREVHEMFFFNFLVFRADIARPACILFRIRLKCALLWHLMLVFLPILMNASIYWHKLRCNKNGKPKTMIFEQGRSDCFFFFFC